PRPEAQALDALQCGETGRADRTAFFQVQPGRPVAHVRRWHRDELGVEPALRVGEAVSVDLVLQLETAHLRAHPGDGAGTVGAEDERKLGLSFRPPACAHLRVPTRRASGVHGDEQLLGSDLRNGEGVDLELLGATKAIDGGCSHGLRNAWHRSDLRVDAKMLRELAKSMRLKEVASARCALRPTIPGTLALLLEYPSPGSFRA